MKIAVVGEPGAWSTERLADAVRALGAEALVVDLTACSLALPEGDLRFGGRVLDDLDGVIVKKIGDTADGWMVRERINLLRHLERHGVPVVSAPDRLEVAVNRYRMTVELAAAGVPVPDTVLTEDVKEAAAAVERFGSAVLKPLYTSKGRGMTRMWAGESLRDDLARHRREVEGPFYIQRFVEHPGCDLGVAVLDGRYLGAYWRVAAGGAWMTTIRAGGRYERATPSDVIMEIALRAANHFGLLFTGVDLIETPDRGFVVLEVSAFGGFRGLLSACEIDAAPLLACAALERFHVSTMAS